MLTSKSTAHRWKSSKKNAWPQYEKKQIQQPGTTFSNLSDTVVVPRGHENSYRFATQWEHQGLDGRVVDFLIRGDAGLMAELRNVVRKKKKRRQRCFQSWICPENRLFFITSYHKDESFGRAAFSDFLCGRCNTKFNQGTSRRSWNEKCHGGNSLSDESEI